MWTKASESVMNQRKALDAITGLVAQNKEKAELEQLCDENVTLREALEEVGDIHSYVISYIRHISSGYH